MQNDKSRIFLSRALMAMMEDKPYGKISIQEIADRAYVSRATFYNHFESKDAVLDFLLERSFGPLCDAPENQSLVCFLNAMKASLVFLCTLQDNGMLHLAPELIARKLMQSGCLSHVQEPDRKLCSTFLSDVFFYEAFELLNVQPHLSTASVAALLHMVGGPFPGLAPVPVKHPKTDKRTAASTRALYIASNSLLEEKPLPQISASDLTSYAHLARSSFYRHFSSMQHFWTEMLRQVFMELLSSPVQLDGHSLLSVSGPLFRAIKDKDKLEIIRFFFSLYSSCLNPTSDTQSPFAVQLEHCRRWCAAVETVISTLSFFSQCADLPASVLQGKLTGFRQRLIRQKL